MPAMALSRVAARAVESGPDGGNLALGAWQRSLRPDECASNLLMVGELLVCLAQDSIGLCA